MYFMCMKYTYFKMCVSVVECSCTYVHYIRRYCIIVHTYIRTYIHTYMCTGAGSGLYVFHLILMAGSERESCKGTVHMSGAWEGENGCPGTIGSSRPGENQRGETAYRCQKRNRRVKIVSKLAQPDVHAV